MSELFISVPTWKDGEWYETDFETKEEFRDYVLMLFKEPGKYRFNEDIYIGNEEARKFEKDSVYCTAPFRSKDFIYYWDEQKRRCQNGILVHSGSVSWYITRDYYMWLNFLPIFNKEIQKFGFAKIRDAQYHMALYELLAELHYKHAAILKKRQIASSYFHIAKLLNQLWFEPGVTLKIGASLKDYINDKGSWKFLDEYASFLNEHTAWYRPMNPNKVLLWQQKIEARKGNRVTEIGLKGTIQGMSFEKSATSGVGGPTKYFFYEEAGIAPKLDQTYEYMRPALQSGMITTGMFIAAGSVGDLDACEPLKRLIMNAEENDIYTVETNLMDADGTIAKAGLFIPEQWSMPPYIDKYGNSLVEEALQAIKDERVKMKKELPPEQYQLRISQKPTNIKEAFAYRKESVFPIHLVSAQLKRCEDKEYPYELIDLFRGDDGALVIKETNKQPIKEFPISKTLENKEGAIVVWERPKRDPTFGMYYASVDPVGEGKTTTSDSLCSIFIYKTATEVTKDDGQDIKVEIEQDGIVASWCGRFDDIKKTHERLELLIEWYNAWTIVENNVSLFIQYMMSKKKQRYLVTKDQMLFLKDLGSNRSVHQEYGWRNTGHLFRTHLISYAIEYLRDEIDQITDENGKVFKTTYGVTRIPDPMLLKEMLAYHPGLNVDRLVAFSALIAFASVQQANRGYTKRREQSNNSLENTANLYKFKVSPFRHIGGKSNHSSMSKPKRAFKNFR
jgi:hypothetical protein